MKWKGFLFIYLLLCINSINAFSLSAARDARLSIKSTTTRIDRQLEERAPPCLDDLDCLAVHTANCQNFTCISGGCYQTDYFCPLTVTSCTVDPGVCSLLDGVCYYPPLDCDDNDPCTSDSCGADSNNVSTCIHLHIPHCVSNNTHHATLRVVDVSVLDLLPFPDDDVVQFCHTSTYRGPDTALLLSFNPYTECTLNERGTCDNRFSDPEPISAECLSNPYNGMGLCSVVGYTTPFSIWLDGMDIKLAWVNSPTVAIAIPDNDAGTIHLHGYLQDADSISTIELKADLWFSGQVINDTGPYVLTLPSPTCQHTTSWSYYPSLIGSLDGKIGSDYEGLHIRLTLPGGSVGQIGLGANNINMLDNGIYAPLHWEIIAQANNPDFLIDPGSFSTGTLATASGGTCSDSLNYCDMFGEPQETPANLWQVDLNNDDLLLDYCRNFSIEQLLNCRNFSDPYMQLFSYVNTNVSTIIYSGTLYATTLDIVGDCQGDCTGEEIISSASYNISITLSSGGDVAYSFTTAYTDFAVFWVSNVWMCCAEDGGNLKVNLKTRIRDDDSFPNVQLCEPYVDPSDETGYPLFFVEPLAPECQMIGDYCYQNWVLRTFNGTGVVDFSGFKNLFWMVCEDDLVTGRVGASMDLFAVHVGDQSHLDDGTVRGELQLYNDRQFQVPYGGETLLEGTFLYGTLCLTNHFHLDVFVKHVYYCYSTEGDIIPYDAMNPMTTGCETQGIDVQKRLIYTTEFSEQDLLVNPLFFHYEQLNNPPYTADCEGFTFKVRAVSPYDQSVQFTWCAQENGGAGGLIEMVSEYHSNKNGHFHRQLTDQDTDEGLFSVACLEDSWIFDEDTFHCRPVHHAGDDDDWDWGVHNLASWGILLGGLVVIIVLVIVFCVCITHSKWFDDGAYYVLSIPPPEEKPSPPNLPTVTPTPSPYFVPTSYVQPQKPATLNSKIQSFLASRHRKKVT